MDFRSFFIVCMVSFGFWGFEVYGRIILPDTLVKNESHVVHFVVDSPESLSNFKKWVYGDLPSSVQYSCASNDCRLAIDLLRTLEIKMLDKSGLGGDNTLHLNYNKLVAFRCRMGQLGCSLSRNLVNSVSDWRVFKRPKLISSPRADFLVDKYRERQGK